MSWEWIEPTWKMVNYEYQLLTLIALFTKFLLEMILNIKDLDSGYFQMPCSIHYLYYFSCSNDLIKKFSKHISQLNLFFWIRDD